jgi:translocation and assembly module TamB
MARLRLILFTLTLAFFTPAFGADDDKGVLASFISSMLSTHTTQVSVGAVDGAFSSDATVRDIVLSDRDGPWLKIDKARLVWTRAALFRRQLLVDQLEIGDIEFLRQPLKGPPNPEAANAPLLPDLPLKLIVKQFTVHQLGLGAPVFGVAAKLGFTGHATLGPPAEGLDLDLESHRLDGPGDILAKLNFVPTTTALSVSLKVDEPAGGLIAHIANLPGLPPVNLSLEGKGPLDGFHAGLDFTAGPDIGANGAIDLSRQGPGRGLALDLKSRIAGFVPAVIANVFAGETDLQGDVFLADTGAVNVKALHLVSQSARLDIEGGVTADRVYDLALHAGAIPGSPEIGKLDLNARLTGSQAKPELVANFDLENLRSSIGVIGAAKATFSAHPDAPLSDPQAHIALAADADVGKLALKDPAQQDLVGSEVKLTLRGTLTPDGKLDIANADLTGASATIAYAGEADAKRLNGRLTVDAGDLSRFAKLSTLALRGAAHVQADVDGSPATGVYAANLDGKVTKLATGVAAIDGFSGGTLTLSGGLRATGDGGYGFDKLALVGIHGRADVDGTATPEKAQVHATIDMPEVKALDPRASGAAAIVADLTGSLAKLDGAVDATLRDGRLLDRATPRLELTLNGHDLTGRLDADAKWDGEIDKKTLSGAAHVARLDGGGWTLDGLAFALGSVKLDGRVSLSPTNLADGQVNLIAGDLDDLSPLVLTRLRGALRADIKLSQDGGAQAASVEAKSAALSFGANSLANLVVDMKASDLHGALALAGSASVARAVIGGEAVTDLKLVAKPAEGGSDLGLDAKARGLALQARGRLALAKRSFRLTTLSARGAGGEISLVEPANVQWGPGSVSVDRLTLGAGGGRVVVSGSAGQRLDLKASLNAVPLALANLVSPGLNLTGKLGGEANVRGALAAPEGDWRVKVDDLSAPALRANGLSAVSVVASGKLGGGRSTVDATLTVPSAGALKLSGSAPLSATGALDLRATGRLDIAAANRLLGATGQRAAGSVVVDATLRGDIAHPNASGSAKISQGSFFDEARGVRIEQIEAEIVARGDEIQVARFHAVTPNGGTLGAEGRVKLDAAAGFPGALKLTGTRAQLISTDVVAARANLAIELSGALARDPKISGRVDLLSVDINIPSQFSGGPRPLALTKHIDPGATARARLAIAARAAAGRAKGGAPFSATLSLVVSAPSRVFLRGRGVDAEFGGEARIAGTTTAPNINGGFELRRGTLVLLGGQLQFTRGKVTFLGDATPELDMTAQTTAADITAYINVAGAASAPTFTFSSNPSLPQDEILSRILYQKSSGSLTAFQALQLANAIAQLSGRGDAFDSLRKALGVDSLDVGADASGGAQVGARKNLNDRLSLGVTSGARPEDNGASLDFNVTKHLKVEGGVDAKGGSTAGVGAQWEY